MDLTELIERLEQIREEHGNVCIGIEDLEFGGRPILIDRVEYNAAYDVFEIVAP